MECLKKLINNGIETKKISTIFEVSLQNSISSNQNFADNITKAVIEWNKERDA